jgi:hypothetical protein
MASWAVWSKTSPPFSSALQGTPRWESLLISHKTLSRFRGQRAIYALCLPDIRSKSQKCYLKQHVEIGKSPLYTFSHFLTALEYRYLIMPIFEDTLPPTDDVDFIISCGFIFWFSLRGRWLYNLLKPEILKLIIAYLHELKLFGTVLIIYEL